MDKRYKYIAFTDKKGKWFGYDLLPLSSCAKLFKQVKDISEVHLSIQNFSEKGEAESCPIYFDLDGDEALEHMRILCTIIKKRLGVTPDVYFSGRRGFHIVVKHYIKHKKCNLIVKYIVDKLCAGSDVVLDPQVYGTKHLIRADGSLHFGGSYKVKLNSLECNCSMEKIRELASQGRRQPSISEHILSKDGIDLINTLIEEAVVVVEREPKYTEYNGDGDWENDIQPCLYRMLTELPQDGKRNMAIYLLARYFKSRGLTFDEALVIMNNQVHWNMYDQYGDVSKVFSSVYNSNSRSGVGCKSCTASAEYMRSLCDSSCIFSIKGLDDL